MNSRQRLGANLLILLLFLLLAACRTQVDVSAPPEILYGQDICDRCNMIISEEHLAAAYWTTAGEALRFDDIGGMLAHADETGTDVATFWVHDVVDGSWLSANRAFFVLNSGLETPMGFGIVAFADQAAADALAYGTAEAAVLDFTSLQAGITAGTIVLDPMHTHASAQEAGMPEAGHGGDHN